MSSTRFLPGIFAFTLLAGCGGDTDAGYQRPAHVPAESRVVLAPAPHSANGLVDISGSEHGIAFTTHGSELRVLRPGREIVTKDVRLSTCPMTDAYAANFFYVLADRVVVHGGDCGLWAFLDGDASPRTIASISKAPLRIGEPEEGRGFDVDLHEWIWEGGATGPRFWLAPIIAFRGDSLFMCIQPPPKSVSVLSNAEVWRMDVEGRGSPERIATLETPSCRVLLVDDEAIYAEHAAPYTAEDGAFRQSIDRVDRKTGAVTRLARLALDDGGYMRDVAQTATHLYVLESGIESGPRRGSLSKVHRVAKSGGLTEAVAGTLPRVEGLRSDGESVFLANEDENVILRIDGTAMTKVVESTSRVSHFRFAVGGGELVWEERGVTGDDDDALFAMPSNTTSAPR